VSDRLVRGKGPRQLSKNPQQVDVPSVNVYSGPMAMSDHDAGRWNVRIGLVIFVCSAILIFARLGYYPLWDDEAVTALSGKGVWATGDTTVLIGRNVVAYGGGRLLKDLHDRSTPPLGAFLAAPFTRVLDGSPFSLRLPFALLGLGTITLILWWLRADSASTLERALVALGLLGNVSLILFLKQCRYYSPAIFASTGIAYLYTHWQGRRSRLAAMAALSLMLLSSNYLNFVALYACLALDHGLWGRRKSRLALADWATLLLPQVLLGAPLVGKWNTLGTGNSAYFWGNGLPEKLVLVYRNLRDMNACEFGPGLLILAAPLLYFRRRDESLLRMSTALLVYVVVVSALSPQPVNVGDGKYADVRYLAPLIPLCMAISVRAILAFDARRWIALGLALVAFETNLLNGGPLQPPQELHPGSIHCTLARYLGELLSPVPDPYSFALKWINAVVPEGSSIWVVPDSMVYPLMYHAPQCVYAWQLPSPPRNSSGAWPGFTSRDSFCPITSSCSDHRLCR